MAKIPEFDAERTVAKVRELLECARQALPHPHALPKAGRGEKYARHNLAHDAIELLIAPLRYTHVQKVLTKEQRELFEALLVEAKELRGY